MLQKEIYLIRHGETDFNRLGIVQGCGVDTSLNNTGILQASAFFQFYDKIPFDLVIHSNLVRSKETVEPFIQSGIEYIEMPEIREISWGIYEGQPYTDSMRIAYKEMIDAWSRNDLDARFTRGESAADLMSRVSEAIQRIKMLPHEKILICSHGRTIRAMMCAFQNLHPMHMENFQHDNTGLFHLEYEGEILTIHTLNDLRHLSQIHI
jgi:broad specificity phosphatase PhoE